MTPPGLEINTSPEAVRDFMERFPFSEPSAEKEYSLKKLKIKEIIKYNQLCIL
jgi:hypothetical protein